ncbi:hypothetical protein [Candidatus Avelusimicrobium alvi]|uniref:hypothetical protein n=1 Tax=Candidatus Avelusimicrobium alvi TaxID=3416221 RepID=UPI003D0D24F8
MEKNRQLFQLGLLIVVLLALGLALLRTTSYSPAADASGRSARERAAEAERLSMEALKNEEILGVPAGRDGTLTKEQKRALAVQRYVRRPDLSLNANDYTLDTQAVGRNPYASLPGTSVGDSSSGSYRVKGLSAADYGKYRGAAGSSAGAATGASSQAPGVYRPGVQEQMLAERERAFSPFMAAMNKEQHKKLESQLKGLSSGIDRAVARALLPKSKKDANIEKYLQRNASPEAAAAGPFAPVLEQVAAQKAGVVNSMGQAFGPQAAKEAGQVMNSFQQEMSAAVTAPGQTPQQIADKVKAVTQKYEQKLQKMTEDNGFRQFEQERLAKDNLLKQALAKQYGADFAALAGEKIDAAREKDMLLARQGLPAEEYYKQQLANQRERRKAIEDLLAQSGKSTKGLFAAEDEVERRDVEQKLKDEEEGKTLGRSYRAGEKELAAIDQSLTQERDEKLRTAGEVYGEEGARRVDGIYQKYYDEYMKIWTDPDSSKTAKQQASMKLRQDVNRQLEQVQNEPQMRQARLERQVESSLSQLMQDPGVSRASAAQKAALEEKARPILREMYERVNDILASDLPDAEKQRRIETVQAQAQRKLSGQ